MSTCKLTLEGQALRSLSWSELKFFGMVVVKIGSHVRIK